jgi:hypothetical protein
MAKYIPEQHYVTWNNFADRSPLAFMTVHGTDAAALQRIATADNWARGPLQVKHTFANGPMTGFRIDEEVRRWTTSNVVWRISDPRGFKLEISSGNMAYLLANTVFNNGLIAAELIWVRDGAINYLLPTDSEEFLSYKRLSVAKESTTKIKDLTVGDYVSLATGEIGTYLGMYSCVSIKASGSGKIIITKRCHIVRDERGAGTSIYVAKSSWKGIKILERGKNENKDYSSVMNENIDLVNGPMQTVHVCMGQFDTEAALASIKQVPHDRHSDIATYFTVYNGQLYQGRVECPADGQDSPWQGWIRIALVDPAQNKFKLDNTGVRTISDSGQGRWLPGEQRSVIKAEEVAGLDKFLYTIVIDNKEYVVGS